MAAEYPPPPIVKARCPGLGAADWIMRARISGGSNVLDGPLMLESLIAKSE